ncbi:MAG: hypothetical protein OJJ54_07340 [Pseudonocardia sp.]|nr:hypothetical protein [Pseudonocardia sp.]
MITVNGIPAHPLVVHAVVVLLPLAALGAVLMAIRPRWRRAIGIPVALLALVGAIAVPIATQTGEQLQRALNGGGPLVSVHESRADTLLPWAIVFAVLVIATVAVGIRSDRLGPEGSVALKRATLGIAVLGALLGIVVAGLVVWIGDSGAAAVWRGSF